MDQLPCRSGVHEALVRNVNDFSVAMMSEYPSPKPRSSEEGVYLLRNPLT